ncbi:WhiB family transcriptional regulator [Nocardia cyriacigeorgica]|uniref:WhiB family transcriptional regulator n=1 Tax=Nocardia cyriacigeorgica TaxID=135487 RepID=UPI0024571791|nr:WhiB family transcriptional regulator [Nocardia cyriacigeorgica]
MTSELPLIERTDETVIDTAQIELARRGVARRAINPDDERRLLAMLGIDGQQAKKPAKPRDWWPDNLDVRDRCIRCGRAMTSRPEGEQVRRGTRELCEPCHLRQKRRPASVEERHRPEFDPTWSNRAACRGHDDPELWFLISAKADDGTARGICKNKCPVRMECAASVAKTKDREGIWAGFHLPDERNQLRSYANQSPDSRTCEECGTSFSGGGGRRRCYGCSNGLVPARPSRDHLLALQDQHRLTGRGLAELVGISVDQLYALIKGKTGFVKPETEAKILGFQSTGAGTAR